MASFSRKIPRWMMATASDVFMTPPLGNIGRLRSRENGYPHDTSDPRGSPCVARRVSRAHNMSGLVAHDLSGSHVYLGGEHEADGIATGGPEDAIRGGLRRMAAREAYPGGGGPGPGGFRPDVPPLCGTV